jgi:hypothetical protein
MQFLVEYIAVCIDDPPNPKPVVSQAYVVYGLSTALEKGELTLTAVQLIGRWTVSNESIHW